MNELQAVELDLYNQFMKICLDNNLRYFAIGGTCLGAIRHKGFIPWDDDIDIAMPIDDYRRFIEIAQKSLKYPYEIYLIKDHPHWCRNFIKIHNSTTTFAEADSREYKDRYTGVYMDIMPIYGMPKGKWLQRYYMYLNDFYQYMNRRQRIMYRKKLRFMNLLVKVIRCIYGKKRKDIDLFNKLIDKKFGKFPFDNSDKILFGWRDRIENFHSLFSYKTVLNYEDFSFSVEVPFENSTMKIPIGYDNYLHMEFGDYMQLPPEEQRVTHNTAIVNLNKSYKEYMKGDV